jgi:DMSO/TMAO reductase YedYZ molybdopterin-dependent catalytic subunit
MGHPEVDPAAFRLKVTGLVDRPKAYSLDQLRALGASDLPAGFECSGNSPRGMQGLSSCGKFTGVALRKVLSEAGIKADAREIVFFGADHREEEVDFRGTKYKVEQQFGRSLTRDDATSPEPMIVWNMNGEPLSKAQGFPLRLIVPGWYGVANVKWLSQIHARRTSTLATSRPAGTARSRATWWTAR